MSTMTPDHRWRGQDWASELDHRAEEEGDHSDESCFLSCRLHLGNTWHETNQWRQADGFGQC